MKRTRDRNLGERNLAREAVGDKDNSVVEERTLACASVRVCLLEVGRDLRVRCWRSIVTLHRPNAHATISGSSSCQNLINQKSCASGLSPASAAIVASASRGTSLPSTYG
jgi:hypothetical protein